MSDSFTPNVVPHTQFNVPVSMPVDGLRSLIQIVLESGGCVPGWPAGRVALEEREAAQCIGVQQHVLRDARLRCKLPHTRVGRTVTYTAQQLSTALKYMELTS